MYAFDFVRPTTLADAVAAMAHDEAQALAGGQTLIPSLKARLASPATLVSLTGISEMVGVCRADDGAVCIGGATTHAQVARDAAAHYPALAKLALGIGDPAVRNRGTIGGSVANNDPAACYPSAVLGSGAVIVTNTRRIDADDYFQGMFTTALESGEIITEVRFPVPMQAAYIKFEQPASRFALTGVYVARYADGVRVAVTGAAEQGVFRWFEAEDALSANFNASAIAGMAPDADGMITDLHGTAAYRAHLVGVLTRRAVQAA
jgi:carbon-monoxide dehydrogenase medium subunit